MKLLKKRIMVVISLQLIIVIAWLIQYYKIYSYNNPYSLHAYKHLLPDRTMMNSNHVEHTKMTDSSSYISIKDNKFFFMVTGFKPQEIECPIKWDKKPAINHDTYKLRWYSLEAINSLLTVAIAKQDRSLLLSTVNSAENWIRYYYNNRLVLDKMEWSDHATARRCQVLTRIFRLLSNKNNSIPRSDSLMELFLLEIIRHGEFLCEPVMSSWESNHGLIVDASLLELSFNFKEYNFSKKWRERAQERIIKRAKYLIADDGSPLEAASSYWFVILGLFTDIIKLYEHVHEDVPNILLSRVEKCNQVLSKFINYDGTSFVFGDSYFKQLSAKWQERYNLTKNIYTDSNIEITPLMAGAFLIRWYDNDNENKMLFTFFDTPPYVHQQADQLAVYLNVNNGSWFQNPGTYSYEISRRRSWFKSSLAQNSVYADNYIHIGRISSPIIYHFDDNSFAARVEKKSESFFSNIVIQREVVFNKDSCCLFINDQIVGGRNKNTKKIISQFILPVDALVKNSDDTLIIDRKDKELFALTINNVWQIDSTLISPSYRKTVYTKKGYPKPEINKNNQIVFSWAKNGLSKDYKNIYQKDRKKINYTDTLHLYNRLKIYKKLNKETPLIMMSISRANMVTKIVFIIMLLCLLLLIDKIYKQKKIFISFIVLLYLAVLFSIYFGHKVLLRFLLLA